jgi:hypothetical protein
MMSGESPQDATSAANSAPLPNIPSGKSPPISSTYRSSNGTILEAAFVDPAYSWPPAEGQGKNAIELQASTALIKNVSPNEADDDDISLTPSLMSSDDEGATTPRPRFRTKKVSDTSSTSRGFLCCKSAEEQVIQHEIRVDEHGNEISDEEAMRLQREYTQNRDTAKSSKAARKQEREARIAAKKKKKRRELRAKERYKRVPEGILVYRLDTSDRTVTLVSGPSSNTDLNTLLQSMVVVHAKPSTDKSRRGIILTGSNGETHELIACEQRTSIAWLESMDMMLAGKMGEAATAALKESGGKAQNTRTAWSTGAEGRLSQTEREEIEERYVNLAAYSNNLIRAGALPGAPKKQKGGAGGIYYTVTQVRDDGEEYDEETLESIAKRRAVIKGEIKGLFFQWVLPSLLEI